MGGEGPHGVVADSVARVLNVRKQLWPAVRARPQGRSNEDGRNDCKRARQSTCEGARWRRRKRRRGVRGVMASATGERANGDEDEGGEGQKRWV